MAIALLLGVGMGGCPPKGQTPPVTGPTPVAAADLPAVAEAVERHNARVERLSNISGRGSIDLRWVDAEGKSHFEPGLQLRLAIERPRRTALRIRKLEQDLLWIGSDDAHYWVFDQTGDETVLSGGPHGSAIELPSSTPLDMRPLTLMDLLGLTALPPPEECLRVEATAEAWVLTAPGAGGTMVVHLDRKTALPQRVASLDDTGMLRLTAETRRYVSVEVRGTDYSQLPKMPSLIDIVAIDDEISLKIGLDDELSNRASPSLFDLERLKTYLGYDRVEGDLPP